MEINKDILTDEGKIICELTNVFTNKNKEIEKLKKDLINLLRIINKNCDDLEGTEEEFDSLDRAENLLEELEKGE